MFIKLAKIPRVVEDATSMMKIQKLSWASGQW